MISLNIVKISKLKNNTFNALVEISSFGEKFFFKYFFKFSEDGKIILYRIEGKDNLFPGKNLNKFVSAGTEKILKEKYQKTFGEELRYVQQ